MASKRSQKPKLTNKQLTFVLFYLENGGNGVQAARSAGYHGSDRTLAVTAYQNLRKPQISMLITARKASVVANLEQWEIRQNDLIQRLASQAFTTVADFMDPAECGLKLKKFEDIDPKHWPAIKSLKVNEVDGGRLTSITLHCPYSAIDRLVSFANLFPRSASKSIEEEKERKILLKTALHRMQEKFGLGR